MAAIWPPELVVAFLDNAYDSIRSCASLLFSRENDRSCVKTHTDDQGIDHQSVKVLVYGMKN